MEKGLRIGFVASRLEGTDGVSLEAKKWLDVLNRMGCECFCFCSGTDWPEDRASLSEEAAISHEEVRKINRQLFDEKKRTEETSRRVNQLKEKLKRDLRSFVERFNVELLIAENAVSLPMNIPLGLAVTEHVAESRIPTIAHHHDFWWERDRYAGHPAGDYLRGAFPPALDNVRHVVINSVAGRELAFRTGINSALVPNVMDFANPPGQADDYAADMRATLGIDKDTALILQPTRIVPRKRIEKAIELIRRLKTDCALVVTHDAGDEGHAYVRYLRELADVMEVQFLMPAERFGAKRGHTAEGEKKVYSIGDAYQQADLITYGSAVEGFGNAFLETIYYKRPILMSAYEIFSVDIQPKGFKMFSFQDFLSGDLVQSVERLLADPGMTAEWTETNYRLGAKHYSLESLSEKLSRVMAECVGKC